MTRSPSPPTDIAEMVRLFNGSKAERDEALAMADRNRASAQTAKDKAA